MKKLSDEQIKQCRERFTQALGSGGTDTMPDAGTIVKAVKELVKAEAEMVPTEEPCPVCDDTKVVEFGFRNGRKAKGPCPNCGGPEA